MLEDLVSQLHLGGTPAWHEPRVPAQPADARNAVVHGALKVVQQRLRAAGEVSSNKTGSGGAEEVKRRAHSRQRAQNQTRQVWVRRDTDYANQGRKARCRCAGGRVEGGKER